MRVSVIIPVKDDLRVLEVVASVAEQLPADGEILLADDGSPGAVPAPRNARVIPTHSENPSLARNEAARAALGDLLLFTDADVRIPLGWVTQGIALFEEPSVVAVQGSSEAIGTGRQARRMQLEYEQFIQNHASTDYGDLCDTRCFAIRRKTFLKFLFDEEEPWCADAALGRRLYEVGISIHFLPKWNVGHFYRDSLYRELERVRRQAAAAAQYLTRTGRDLFRSPQAESPAGVGWTLLRAAARWPTLAPPLAAAVWAAALGAAALACAPEPLGRRLFNRACRAARLSGRLKCPEPRRQVDPSISKGPAPHADL